MNPTVKKVYDGALAGFGIFFGWSLAQFALGLLLTQINK